VGCVRSKILSPTGFLDIKANKKEGGVRRLTLKRLVRPTEIKANSKNVGNFFILVYKKKFPNNLT